MLLHPQASLILVDISEPAANALRLILLEATPQGAPVTTDLGLTATPILPTPDCKAISIAWGDYIIYHVLNESFAVMQDDEPQFDGLLAEIDTPTLSGFLDKYTFANNDYPGPFKSWLVTSENHVVYVTSCSEPEVSRVDVEARWLDRDGPRLFQARA